jgi:hypothetical protein
VLIVPIETIVSIGDLLIATEHYHKTFAQFKWAAYCDFMLGEVIETIDGGFILSAIDVKWQSMQFGNNWIYRDGYLQKLYVKQI